ncbi:MAG: hypothetical protein H8D23_40140 [Candidatus Brocadiales bacterium]|nr:hypothetical protein [Candidatus Brocadiales bacterium]
MTERQNFLERLRERNNLLPSVSVPDGESDLCPVCDGELYQDEKTTRRCGILNIQGEVEAWICPYCVTEFDMDDNVICLLSDEIIQGEA